MEPTKQITDFMQQMKVKCEAQAKKFAGIELSIWDDAHEKSLKGFGYSEKEIIARKKKLTTEAG